VKEVTMALTSDEFHRVNSLNDNELKQYLREGTERELLVEYFGGEEAYESLKKIVISETPAVPADSKAVFGVRGSEIILLPGIMGSELEDKKGTYGKVWLNLITEHFLRRPLTTLLLDEAGQTDADNTISIEPIGLYRGSYFYTQNWLENQGHTVYPFAYDWRKSNDVSAKQLRNFVEEKGKENPDKKFVFVAHSMGGLVARRYLDLFGEQAEKRLYKLIMLGTPNHGSYLPMKVMIGQGGIDLKIAGILYGKELLQGIIQSFPGLYEMLPNPDLSYFDQPDIYNKDYWGEESISNEHLTVAQKFQRDIEAAYQRIKIYKPDLLNRMALIANKSLLTVTRVELETKGHIQHRFIGKRVGDDTVPFKSAYLEGVPTYLTQAKHSKIQQNENVLNAIHNLVRGIKPNLEQYRPTFGIETPIEMEEIDPDKIFLEL
jgi:pimeloyl-ACP methyl ester carboxylesterase